MAAIVIGSLILGSPDRAARIWASERLAKAMPTPGCAHRCYRIFVNDVAADLSYKLEKTRGLTDR